MTPFDVPPSLVTFTKIRPSGQDIYAAARSGCSDTHLALARTWISEGIPVAFEECPAVYDSMRGWLADKLNIHAKQIGLTGSARFGSSFVHVKVGRDFGPDSDLDFFVVSDTLFGECRADFHTWHEDYRSFKVKPGNSSEGGYWRDNAKRVPQNIRRGFIDVNKIPAHRRYKTAQRTLNTMSQLVRELKKTPKSPSPERASVRCYDGWASLVKQMSLSLQQIREESNRQGREGV